MPKRQKDRLSKGKGRRAAHNKLTKKYERQRARTEANKARRRAKNEAARKRGKEEE